MLFNAPSALLSFSSLPLSPMLIRLDLLSQTLSQQLFSPSAALTNSEERVPSRIDAGAVPRRGCVWGAFLGRDLVIGLQGRR